MLQRRRRRRRRRRWQRRRLDSRRLTTASVSCQRSRSCFKKKRNDSLVIRLGKRRRAGFRVSLHFASSCSIGSSETSRECSGVVLKWGESLQVNGDREKERERERERERETDEREREREREKETKRRIEGTDIWIYVRLVGCCIEREAIAETVSVSSRSFCPASIALMDVVCAFSLTQGQ